MSLLKDLIGEMAAGGSTGAGGVAGFRGSLFGGRPITRLPAKKIPKITYSRIATKEGTLNKGGVIDVIRDRKKGETQLQYAMSLISEDLTGSTDFDASDVLSKLEAAEKKAETEKDTATFGLENEDGGIVRVYVRKDQAEEFEQALAQLLAGNDDNEDKENTSLEIAEVLFKLKDRFDIVDVDWGDIPEDEEQEQTVGDEQGGEQPAEGQPGQEGEQPVEGEPGQEGENPEGGEDMGAMDQGGGEEQAKSALDSVIDMMKADAKAKQAEADARAAEARAKEAEWTAVASAHKVKQEEEILDMETHEKEIQQQEKEAKRLAKLAKYRHDKAAKYSGELHGSPDPTAGESEEEEEQGGAHVPFDPALRYKGYPNDKNRMSLEQLRDLINYHLKGVNK